MPLLSGLPRRSCSYALGEEIWQAVVDDWRTAPVRPELTATLVFLEKLTLRPEELTPADADAVRAAGVSEQALRDAATVCALFSMIVRLADSFGWDVPEWDAAAPAGAGDARGRLRPRLGLEAGVTICARPTPTGGACDGRAARARPGSQPRAVSSAAPEPAASPAAGPAAFRVRLYDR